jgi:hypothetical protein
MRPPWRSGNRPVAETPTPAQLPVMPASAGTENFDVAVLYDHFTSVGRAMAAYSHLTRELELGSAAQLHIWRIDVAASPEFFARADVDIREAEIVILAARDNRSCPPEFLPWADGTGNGFGLPKRALIALVETVAPPDPSPRAWSRLLRRMSERALPHVFLWESPAAPCKNPPEFAGAIPGRPTLSHGQGHGRRVGPYRREAISLEKCRK